MTKEAINPQNAPAPVGPFSQVVRSHGLLFCSGQIALDVEVGKVVGESIEEQTQKCLENLAAVLDGVGSGPAQILKLNAYLTDMGLYDRFNRVYSEFFRDADRPARATFAVKGLPLGALVEVECIAEDGAAG